jgi:RNA polymerase sigma-70 factor, ECF subfamily
MTSHDDVGDERARRFRDLTLPCLDDAYRLAYVLMRNRTDAEDAVQECYLRALRHFDTYRGPAIKPWLLMILRNVCYGAFAKRGQQAPLADDEDQAEQALWQEPQAAPDAGLLRTQESAAVRQLVDSLPAPFREVIVLREFNDMSYREIAEVAGVPVGTVMSRLARGRALLLAAWKAREGAAQLGLQRLSPQRPPSRPSFVDLSSSTADRRHRPASQAPSSKARGE